MRLRGHGDLPDSSRRGFGLLELMIAMAVVALLLGIAIPSYQQYALRAHRAEAVRTLLAAATCQERLRAASGYYDTSRCASGLDNGHYAFRIEPVAEPESLEFTLFADPLRHAPADGCGTLGLDQAGTRSVSGSAAPGDCWGGR